MPAGLQVWDANGVLILDTNDKLLKFIGIAELGSGSAATGTITDSRFTAYSGATPFFIRIDDAWSDNGKDAQWSFSGNNLSWSFPSSDRPYQKILYGVE